MNDVLSGTAGYLQHDAPGGQNARKDIEYRAFVALCRREEPFPVSLFLAMLSKHQMISCRAGRAGEREGGRAGRYSPSPITHYRCYQSVGVRLMSFASLMVPATSSRQNLVNS